QQKAQALTKEIAERRTAQRELARREEELRDFLENAVIGMHWVAEDGTVVWANRAEMELLGYEPHEYIGQNITKFHYDNAVIADILARLQAGDELRAYPARLRHKDGTLRHV